MHQLLTMTCHPLGSDVAEYPVTDLVEIKGMRTCERDLNGSQADSDRCF
jgi:hypothetical protein